MAWWSNKTVYNYKFVTTLYIVLSVLYEFYQKCCLPTQDVYLRISSNKITYSTIRVAVENVLISEWLMPIGWLN